MAEATFIAAADLHLGRPIASLPEALRTSERSLGPFAALERIVDLAVRERADAVLLAGDLVDDDGAYFEVFSAIQHAVATLDGIPMIAIAGNHDANVLPKLAESIEGLTLLGKGGQWQAHALPTDAGDVEILGWSFPDSHCRRSPFEAPPPPRAGRRIALLHGDLDASNSVYAPFTRADLRHHGADAWLLGHVHVPSFEALTNAQPIGYLGSACGLDPSETGPHGAWVVRCRDEQTTVEHRPIAPTHWARTAIESSAIDLDRLESALHEAANRESLDSGEARAVGVRVVVGGEHERWAELNERIATLDLGGPWTCEGRTVFLDRVVGRSGPSLQLESLAQEPSAAGRIASLILELEAGGADEIVERVAESFADLAGLRHFRIPPIGERAYPTPDARRTLVLEARAVLGELLAQHPRSGS